MTRAAFLVASSLVVALACKGEPSATSGLTAAASPRPARATPAAADDQVRATVERVLTLAEHPGLKWSDIHDVAATLTPLYNAEADRLLWFTGSSPDAPLDEALAAISAAERSLPR